MLILLSESHYGAVNSCIYFECVFNNQEERVECWERVKRCIYSGWTYDHSFSIEILEYILGIRIASQFLLSTLQLSKQCHYGNETPPAAQGAVSSRADLA